MWTIGRLQEVRGIEGILRGAGLSSSSRRRLARQLSLVAVVALALARASYAERSDVVTLSNDDQITGEVKELRRGKLRFKTDHLGTIDIEWEHVVELVSKETFEVEVESGETYYGILDAGPEKATLSVSTAEDTWLLAMDDVVLITPIGATFLSRIDGSFDLGLTFASANTATTFNTAFQASHRTRKYLRKLDFSSIYTDQENADEIQRTVSTFELSRFIGQKWNTVAAARLESNEELGLDLRASVTAAMRRTLRQTNQSLFSAQTGLVVNEEKYTGATSTENLEAVGSIAYEKFQFHDPETEFSISFAVLPSISNSGRVRAELESRLRRELISDFFLALSLWATHDSEPPVEDLEQTDYGFTTSLGYSF